MQVSTIYERNIYSVNSTTIPTAKKQTSPTDQPNNPLFTKKKSTMAIIKQLECDYLIVGAGASPLAFVDTLLTELPDKKVIIIDKKSAPGGHWVDSYGFIHLHQPSLVYGLSSKQLEGNWLKLMLTKGMLPWNHRASKEEILKYYGSFVEEKIASKQLQFYPNTVYDFEKKDNSVDDGIHYFSSIDGSLSYKVKVNEKLVDGTQGECIIPHGKGKNSIFGCVKYFFRFQ